MAIAGVVRVKREMVAARMTCPLCHELLRDATTISECLHTFCRKCIFVKLTDEEEDCCPICNIDLGCVPVEKLRPDHNLQDLREKIFPYKRRNVNAVEVPSLPLPVRRKERSLSSLVVNTPRVQTSSTGRRTKAGIRRGISPVTDELKKDNHSSQSHADNSCSPESSSKIILDSRQGLLNLEHSDDKLYKEKDNTGDPDMDKAELWKPLNCLVEVANRSKSLKSTSPSPAVKTEKINGLDGATGAPKTKIKELSYKIKACDDEDSNGPSNSVSVKSKKLRGSSRRKREHQTSAQTIFDAALSKRVRVDSPIWLSLVAAADQKGDAPLPQLSANYLRIKDGNLSVSFLHKYIAKKLDLSSESEVEIMCRGQPVAQTTTLQSILDLCLQKEPTQRSQISIGSSAKNFVMLLTYRHRSPSLQSQ